MALAFFNLDFFLAFRISSKKPPFFGTLVDFLLGGVEIAFNLILKDPSVKAILVNIFGGIVRCDRVAQGIIDAYKSIGTINIPIIVRLEGTNADIAKKFIDESGLDVHSVIEFQEAADKVQEVLA